MVCATVALLRIETKRKERHKPSAARSALKDPGTRYMPGTTGTNKVQYLVHSFHNTNKSSCITFHVDN